MISPRGARILGLVAVVSVTINLFIAGSFLGGRFRGPPQAVNFEQRLDEALDALPEADKPIAKEIFALHRDEIIQKWRASRMAAGKAGKGMRAKIFNEAEVEADLDASNDRFLDFRKALQSLFLDIGGKISPEGRQRLRAPGAAF